MKPVRIIALGLIGVFIARQFQQSGQGANRPQASLASQPDHLLSARASAPSSPRQGAVASRDTHLPDYTPEEPAPAKRQPQNTPPEQKISGTPLTNNTPNAR